MVISRAYNQFQFQLFGQIRKSSETERLADEINYYRIIQRDINKAIFFPRLIAAHTETNNNWMILEQYAYDTLGSALVGNIDHYVDWYNVFNNLSIVLSQFEVFTDPMPADPSYISAMLIDKTESELETFMTNRTDLNPLFESYRVIINNKELGGFLYIWNDIKEYIKTHMLNYTSTMIHGDMCFSNILFGNENIVRFIDPRGSFGKTGIYGDQRYDIAKLYHSVDGGYEFFIHDYFSVQGDHNTYELSFDIDRVKQIACTAFEQKFFDTGAFNKKEIKIIQGCIFLGMCARHYDGPDRQLAMYLTGLRLLNEALEL